MKTASFALAMLSVALMGNDAFSQRKPINKRPATISTAKREPGYELHLKLAAGGKIYASMVSAGAEGEIGPSDLKALITDLPGGADKFNLSNNLFPKVEIAADPAITMLDFWNPVTLFRRGRSDVRVSVPNGMTTSGSILIAIPWNNRGEEVDIKPNPLSLFVTVTDDGGLELNNEPAGNLNNTKTLSDRLREIFKAREVNGVFRPGTNDIEKSVTIILPMGDRKFADLITIARAIWLPGGDRISLVMETDEFPSVRKSLIDVPLAPAKQH